MIANTLQAARDCLNRGNHAEAKSLCQQVLRKKPNNFEALKLLGFIAMSSGDFKRAIQIFAKVISRKPKSAIAYYNLGLAYINAGEASFAVQNFKKSIELKPDLACVYGDFCLALTRCGDIEAAISAGEEAVSLLPDNAIAHCNLAQAYDAWKSYDSAYKHYQKAAELLPNHPGIQLALATAYVGFGNTKAASECYRKVIKLYPEDVESYRQLARINKFASTDHEDVQKLKAILSESWLNDEGRASILSALGKIYQDCKLYDDAFAYYEQANKLQETLSDFVPEVFADYISSLIKVLDSEILSEKRTLGNVSKAPVFIVGVPRSGTSLVEQILSSHHDVFGAGELTWIGQAASSIQGSLKTTTHYPECVQELTDSNINELAEKYLLYLNSLADNESWITDKMPNNFLHLGFIHILFPNAKIIHCRRDSKDSCVSMYTEYFPDGLPYSYDLLKLGAFYKQYERIMNHWRTVLPEHAMMDIDYESLVTNQEEVSRQLVEFIGMPWDDACLTFYQKQGRVNTASDLQVKKPMYSSSIGRWKHYQKHLQPLEQGFKYWD